MEICAAMTEPHYQGNEQLLAEQVAEALAAINNFLRRFLNDEYAHGRIKDKDGFYADDLKTVQEAIAWLAPRWLDPL